jgi:hypothetical protein
MASARFPCAMCICINIRRALSRSGSAWTAAKAAISASPSWRLLNRAEADRSRASRRSRRNRSRSTITHSSSQSGSSSTPSTRRCTREITSVSGAWIKRQARSASSLKSTITVGCSRSRSDAATTTSAPAQWRRHSAVRRLLAAARSEPLSQRAPARRDRATGRSTNARYATTRSALCGIANRRPPTTSSNSPVRVSPTVPASRGAATNACPYATVPHPARSPYQSTSMTPPRHCAVSRASPAPEAGQRRNQPRQPDPSFASPSTGL